MKPSAVGNRTTRPQRGPSLLDEFRSTKMKETRCVVWFKVSPEVRAMIEDGIRRNIGPVTIVNFLRGKGLWTWSESPITTHRRHV